jgi:hypothetical protein
MISQGTDQILRCQVTEGSNRDRGRRAVPVAPLAHHRAGAHRVGLNDGARDDCDQDYVRADLLEAAIVEDVKGILRDEQFMARIWEEANRRLCAEKPSLDQEIAKVEAEIAKVRATIDRYFAAFEAQTMRPELCMQKVEALNAQVEALASEKRALEERREHLEIPAIDRDMLSGLLDEFERVIAEGTNPEKKDLLHRLVKKVLIHDRGTIEIWYALPNQTPVRTPAHPAARMCQSTNHPLAAVPEIWFRIRHIAVAGGDGPPVDEFRELTVEVAVGPKGALKHCRIGTLRRRVASSRVVTAGPTRRCRPTPPRAPRAPRVAELLRKAIEWQALLDYGQVANQAAIARREGITRARVTQVLGLLRLPPKIQEEIMSLPDSVRRPAITERALRPIAQMEDLTDQKAQFHELLGRTI